MVLVLRRADVAQVLSNREADVLGIVRRAYELHEAGMTAVPHSTFLRFPGSSTDRIIGLPAYVGGAVATAGVKWIASFPGNVAKGRERASATILLNSMKDGHPTAVVEGSLISAARTAASAALAACLLAQTGVDHASVIGCGVINLDVVRYLKAAQPALTSVTAFDIEPVRAAQFASRCRDLIPGITVEVASDVDSALCATKLVSIATTATRPHLKVDLVAPVAVLLHLSLRDLYPATILSSQNVVDDADHVCREQTSLHLAERETGSRHFIDATIGQILRPSPDFKRDPTRPVVFSPFGLGALDIALAQFVTAEAARQGMGITVDDFTATAR